MQILDIKKIQKTVFIKEFNTIAHFLENGDIVVQLWYGVFYNRKECFEYIETYCPGWIQSTETCRKYLKEGKKSGATDFLKPYEDLYDELEKNKA